MRTDLNREIARASGVLLIGNLLALILGVANTLAIAACFGTGGQMDAFALARTIPDAAWTLFSLLIARVYLPLFTGHLRDRAALSALFSSAVNLLLCISGLLSLGIFLVAPALSHVLVPADRPEVRELVTHIVRLFSVTFVLSSLFQVWTAVLQAHKQFLLPALSQSTGRGVMLVVVLAMAPRLGIYALVLGTLTYFGLTLMGVTLAGSRAVDYSPWQSPRLAWSASKLVLGPLLLLSVLERIHDLLLRAIATGLPAGSVAALDYANSFLALLLVLLNAALLQAIFPFISELVRDRQADLLAQTLNSWLRVVLAVLIPTAMWLIILREPVVRLLFQRGAFNERSVALTCNVLACSLLAIVPLAISGLLELLLLSDRRLRWCFVMKSVGMLTSLLLAALLSRQLGVQGVAAGFATGMTVQAAVGLGIAAGITRIRWSALGITTLKAMLCALLACLPAWYWFTRTDTISLSAGTAWLGLQLVAGGSLSCAIYCALGWLAGMSELNVLKLTVGWRRWSFSAPTDVEERGTDR